jgi:hypothetical protein
VFRLSTAVVLVAVTCFCTALTSSPTPRHATAAARHPARAARRVSHALDPGEAATAERAYAAMRARFAIAAGLYADRGHRYAYAWPLSQALDASLELAQIPDERGKAARADALRTFRGLEDFRFGKAYASAIEPPLGRGGVRFYDDNEWLAQDMLLGYRVLGRPALLRRAEDMFRFLVSGWDDDPGDACSGGVFWADTPTIRVRNTVSTANAALVALRLYQETRQRTYLGWAKRMYAWISRCLAGPDRLYFDHLDRRGNIDKSEWTYNQGAMIAAGVLLARATGETRYLDQAERLAGTALAHYKAAGYAGEPAIFVAIFFRDLRLLDRARPRPLYGEALRDYLDRDAVPAADGSFGRTLLDQAAAAQLYSLAATN